MKYLIVLLISLCSASAFGQADIDIYLETALENNPELKAKHDQYMAAKERIPQAQALSDPRISAGFFLQSVETRLGRQTGSLALNQSFPWFGTLKARGETAALSAEVQLASYEETRVRLYRDIKLAINQVYLVDRSIQITIESQEILQSFKELARVNFENGNSSFVDLLLLEMEEEELRVRIESLTELKSTSLITIEQLLNAPLPKPLEFSDSLSLETLPNASVLLDSIKSNNSRINTLSKLKEVKASETGLVDLMSKPSFTIGASYINIAKRTDIDPPSNGRDAILLPQVGMTLPIFRKKYDAMERQIEWETKSIEHQVESQKNLLTSQLEKYLTEISDSKRRMSLYQDLTELSMRARTLMETGFSTSDNDFEDLITIEKKLLSYKLELEKARVDHNNAINHINYLLGR